jgi:hypothetical protein
LDIDRKKVQILPSIEKSKTKIEGSIEKLKVDFEVKKDKSLSSLSSDEKKTKGAEFSFGVTGNLYVKVPVLNTDKKENANSSIHW